MRLAPHLSFYARYHRPASRRLAVELAAPARMSGGGSLYDLGAYVLDLIHYLLGDVAEVNDAGDVGS
jgi:predicted dehydrogenase